jgi:hypothetical protein
VIEQRLRESADAYFPATPPLAAAARARLTPGDNVLLGARRRSWPLAVAFAALVVTGTALAATSLGLVPGVRVQRVAEPPTVPFTQFPGYGLRVSPAEAAGAVPFRLLLPDDLGTPDRVLLDRDRSGAPVVTAVYGGERAARLVLTQWVAGAVLFEKMLGYETRTEYVDVGGAPGLWIEGSRFHDVFYLSAGGAEQRAPGFLAGNVLVWQRGAVSYRLEAGLTQERALELAATLRPA